MHFEMNYHKISWQHLKTNELYFTSFVFKIYSQCKRWIFIDLTCCYTFYNRVTQFYIKKEKYSQTN